jgi:sedoheptulose-bisphosphatase
VFCNPVSDSAPAKLRLLYEVAPLAFVVEAAGGSSDNGGGSVLALKVTTAEDRCSVALGSAEEVARCLPAFNVV